MLFVGLLLAVVCSTALARPGFGQGHEAHHGHEMVESPFGRGSLTQVVACDVCNETIVWLQREITNDKELILMVVEMLGQVCNYFAEPYQANCVKFFEVEIPIAIDEFLELDPIETCTILGFCSGSPGFREHVVRDRVIKQMMRRTRAMQQNMIMMTMRQDKNFLCTKCHDAVQIARDTLLDNNTQNEVVNFVYEICDYFPDNLYGNCTEVADSVPAIMEKIANDIFDDSVCEQIGLCNDTVSVQVDPMDTDIGFGNPDIGRGQAPYIPSIDIPRIDIPLNPERDPYGVPQRPEIRPQRPYNPRPGHAPNPSFNLDDILGEIQDIGFDTLENANRRRQRSVKEMLGFDFDKIMPEKLVPMDKVIEYLPEPYPSAGIDIKPEKPSAPGKMDCVMCKEAVSAVRSWIEDNKAEIERMVLQVAQPVCNVLPLPFRQDCTTDVTEFIEYFLSEAIGTLQPDRFCKWLGACVKDKHLPKEILP